MFPSIRLFVPIASSHLTAAPDLPTYRLVEGWLRRQFPERATNLVAMASNLRATASYLPTLVGVQAAKTTPRHSMYAIYAYIDPQNHPNVGKYTIHGVSGTGWTVTRFAPSFVFFAPRCRQSSEVRRNRGPKKRCGARCGSKGVHRLFVENMLLFVEFCCSKL